MLPRTTDGMMLYDLSRDFLEDVMRCFSTLVFVVQLLVATTLSYAQSPSVENKAPLRVALVGLVHGHVLGFLQQPLPSSEIPPVGSADHHGKLAVQYAPRYRLATPLILAAFAAHLQQPHHHP